MAGPKISVTLEGDASDLDRALDRAGDAAIAAGKDFDRAGDKAHDFGRSMDNVSDAVDTSEGKFGATADLLDGLGGAFGLPIDGAVNMARSFGDMASGVTGIVLPAMQSLWATMAANPIFLVIAAVVAIGAALVVAYQKVEWFRDFVDKAFDKIQAAAGWVRDRFDDLVSFVREIPGRLASLGSGMWDWITSGLKSVLNLGIGLLETFANTAIKSITAPVGVLNKIPGIKSIVPDVPKVKLPRLATGGIVTAPTVALIGEAGPEAVVPLGRAGGVGATTNVYQITVHAFDTRDGGQAVIDAIRTYERRNGASWRNA